MGDKTQKEMVELLKAIAIHSKCAVEELRSLSRKMDKHMAEQSAGLKAWQDADTKHHLTDNGTLAEIVVVMNATLQRMNWLFGDDKDDAPVAVSNEGKEAIGMSSASVSIGEKLAKAPYPATISQEKIEET